MGWGEFKVDERRKKGGRGGPSSAGAGLRGRPGPVAEEEEGS